MSIALDIDGLHIAPVPNLSWLLIGVIAVCVLLTAAIVLVSLRPPRRGRKPRDTGPAGAHARGRKSSDWQNRVDDVLRRYHDGTCTREEALLGLAALTRAYASEKLERNMSTMTLADLNRRSGDFDAPQQADLLRETIAAFYPPEFAARGERGGNVTVDESAGWVRDLIDRWR